MSDDVPESRATGAALALFALIAALIGADVAADYVAGGSDTHVLAELAVLLLACAGVALLWRRLQQARTSLSALRADLDAAHALAERWRGETRELIHSLSAAIEAQFQHWELSAAEKEIALLLLKGLSHKEIAALRDTSERTVREQARAVYRKAGLSGRSALSAFFLEDLLLPGSAAGD